jgi:hypothetical protein
LPAPEGVEPILAVSQGLLAVIVPQSGEFVIDPETWAITVVNDELALVHYVIRVTATLQDGGEFGQQTLKGRERTLRSFSLQIYCEANLV